MLQISVFNRVLIWLTVAAGLLLASPNFFYTTVEKYNDATALIETGVSPNAETAKLSEAELSADASGWPSFLPSSLVNLGLDLRGGAHLLAEVQVEDVYDDRMDGYWLEMREVLRNERATVGTIRRQNAPQGELRVRISQPENMERALQLVRSISTPVVSLTGVGSNDIDVRAQGDIIIVTLSDAEKIATNDRTIQQSLEIIRRRVDEVGTREPTIQRQGERRILIQVPGIGSAAELKALIGTTAKLTFHPVVSQTSNPNEAPGPRNIIVPSIDPQEQGVFYILEQSPVVTGEELADSQPAFDQNGSPAVTFRFNAGGARKFGIYTAENVGSPFAIVLDNEVISAPVIREAISGGSGQISGNFTVEESTNLAVLLRAGALPAEMTFLEERTIGPELGQDSIDAGKIACIVAFAMVLVFMFLSYGTFGLFANIALILNVGMIFGLLSLIGATLTLPGIAGIVLTIGMAVDANVLIFERIREELKSAKGPARAIELGYEKALSAILDANITTFITAVILFAMGSGPVRGFAITLGLGILTSVFTAIFVTRVIIIMWYDRKRPKTIEV
ncbi:MAG: protein translocase subunit SecD [Pseudomonadota bacterium]